MSQETQDVCPSSTGPSQKEKAPHNELDDDQIAIRQNLSGVRNKILVLSGKGGVGKSTVSVNLAMSLAQQGKTVGLLDVDIHGPSVPKMLGLEQARPDMKNNQLLPIDYDGQLKVMSLGFLMNGQDEAIIWRGPMKAGVIRQMIRDTLWASLDYLIVDCPPGTGDEPLSVVQLFEDATGAVVVTTPQEIALADVRRSINFCRQVSLPVLGVVENMSGFVCPDCGKTTEIFKSGGGEAMANEMNVPFLGRVPINLEVMRSCDSGRLYTRHYSERETAGAFEGIALAVMESTATPSKTTDEEEHTPSKGNGTMRIAIPIAEGQIAMHFGHCAQFALVDVDEESKEITGGEVVDAPPHQPGLLPPWLAERGVNLVVAGGMGSRAQQIFAQHNIEVLVGAQGGSPEEIAKAYLDGSLATGQNVCDH